MKKCGLLEDILPPRLKVKLSKKIIGIIEDVNFYNKFEKEELALWHGYLVGMIRWVSNQVISWDNIDKYYHNTRKNIHRVKDNGYDVTFIIKSDKSAITIIKANLDYKSYGLRIKYLYEKTNTTNNRLTQIITEAINTYLKRECISIQNGKCI